MIITDEQSGLREGYAEIGDVRLHYVEAGDGPLIILLHGFPEFWYGWRQQIEPLAAAGFRVVAPDMRGYNLSSKPTGVAAHDTDQLTADIRGLVQERGAESALLVGHDWGAAYTPQEIERYVEAWPDLGAHTGHLGARRSLPRPRTSRARPRRRTQPRPRRAPARRVALGPSRRG